MSHRVYLRFQNNIHFIRFSINSIVDCIIHSEFFWMYNWLYMVDIYDEPNRFGRTELSWSDRPVFVSLISRQLWESLFWNKNQKMCTLLCCKFSNFQSNQQNLTAMKSIQTTKISNNSSISWQLTGIFCIPVNWNSTIPVNWNISGIFCYSKTIGAKILNA